MELDDVKGELVSGFTSLSIALAVTYSVSMAYPTTDIQWALTAVGFASFFSGFFSHYYAVRE